MRHAEVVTSTAVATSLGDLLLISEKNSDGILLQLLTGTVSIGNRSNQPFPLVAATPVNLKNQRGVDGLYLIGVGTVAIGLF